MEKENKVTSIENGKRSKPLPNKAFDMEYHTERYREVQFLADRGFQYTFVKTNEYGVSQYKYKKTPALFAALVEFYSILEAEKSLKKKKTNVVPLKGGTPQVGIPLEVIETAELKTETIEIPAEIIVTTDDTE